MPRKKKSESGTQSEHSDSNDSTNEEQLNNTVEEEIEEPELEETQLEEDNDELENQESGGQGLSLNILIHVRTLLETAIKRGAYKPNELSTVGKIYDIFNSSLNYIESQDNDNNSS